MHQKLSWNGKSLGLAFQVIDDILDIVERQKLGKKTGRIRKRKSHLHR